jgi:ferric-dicitrate binding protein FerR (iron transport regulator)
MKPTMHDLKSETLPVRCCRRTSVDGVEQLIFETPAGQRITLQDSPAVILVGDSNQNSVRLDAGGITITSAAQVTVTASEVQVTAAMLTVNAAMTKFSGVVQADTITANTVVANQIAPGGGNVW